MKRIAQALSLALLAASINAQTTTVVNDPMDTGTTTIYYSTCPSAAETTITLSSTLTYCPGNNCGGGPAITAAPSLGQSVGNDGKPLGTEIIDYTTIGANGLETHFQVFETVYPQACSTCPGGTAPQTFTITEECPCISARPSTYMPSGFTTTVYSCDVSGSPTTLTITTPCSTGPYASQATTAGGAGAGNAGAPGTGATGTEISGAETTGSGGAPGYATSVADDEAPTATPIPGTGGPGSNSTVSPPITPVAPGSGSGSSSGAGSSGSASGYHSGTPFKGSATYVGLALWTVFGVVAGALAWQL